ncbi:MAG TPA: CPBP family glutamic-type intramembrane protease [Gemmataceae bacterium]|nr:CPBP family glutamic-type intramembrane protease [Gemmataceae bacterium]
MLFLLKRTWLGGLAGLAFFALLGLGLRHLLPEPPPIDPSWRNCLLGVAVVGAVLFSDLSLHGLFCLAFGAAYRRRHRELAEVFRGQGLAAILAGAAMAGLGEELVFRGLSLGVCYLIVSAVVFGLLHHVRRSLWPFTLWAVWQGLLFAAALWYLDKLSVTMTAHFLHDFSGFLIFRWLNATKRVA